MIQERSINGKSTLSLFLSLSPAQRFHHQLIKLERWVTGSPPLQQRGAHVRAEETVETISISDPAAIWVEEMFSWFDFLMLLLLLRIIMVLKSMASMIYIPVLWRPQLCCCMQLFPFRGVPTTQTAQIRCRWTRWRRRTTRSSRSRWGSALTGWRQLPAPQQGKDWT